MASVRAPSFLRELRGLEVAPPSEVASAARHHSHSPLDKPSPAERSSRAPDPRELELRLGRALLLVQRPY